MIDNFFKVNQDNTVEYDPSLKNIEVFKTVIINARKNPKGGLYDAGKTARIANEKLSYAYLMSSPHSMFFYTYNDLQEREEKVLRALGVKDWQPDKYDKEAIEFLETELNDLIAFRLFRKALKAAYATEEYFDNIDYTEKDAKGNLVYSPRETVGMLKDIGDVIDGIEEMQKRYRREMVAQKKKFKGKKRINPLELPPDQRRK